MEDLQCEKVGEVTIDLEGTDIQKDLLQKQNDRINTLTKQLEDLQKELSR